MIKIASKSECCGCEACANICPQKCIVMKPDEEGFLYPEINVDKCIGCNLCDKTCPFKNFNPTNSVIKAYAVQTKDKSLLAKTASGGAYSSLARYIVENGGIAIGASYVEGKIQHTCAETMEGVKSHSSSKYVQSEMNDIYVQVKNILCTEPEKKVLFSGTPCQVAGLKKFLEKEYAQLYTVDFACGGICSPKIFHEYVKLMSKRYDGIIEELNFKKKTYGYHSSTMSLTFDNGKVYSQSRLTDPMMKIFNAYIANRPSCGECVTKVEKGYSDFTIFDCWHFSELTGKPDNDLGYTNVLIRTEKAHNLLKKCSNLMDITEIKVNEVLSFDRGSSLFESMTPNKDRENFFIEFQNYGLMSAIKTFIPITYVSHIKEWIKKSLYKLGMLRKVKKIVRR